MKRPNSMRHLDDAIRRLCGGAPQDFVRARTVMANAIVASMLPDGVVKGGSALKMRFGEENTRFTTDLDTATATDPAAYAAQLDSRLRSGWEGFSGRVVEKDPALNCLPFLGHEKWEAFWTGHDELDTNLRAKGGPHASIGAT